jgi:Domain of unknown function (DUF1854)
MTDPTHNPTHSDESTQRDEAVKAPVSLCLETLDLHLDERGRLLARHDEKDVLLIARRAFPWTNPTSFISLRTKEGVEVLMIESMDAVPPASRNALKTFLTQSTFIPRITQIENVNLEHGYQLWNVQTESGPAELRVQEREDIRFLSEGRFCIKDANGNVYEIPDLSKLDDHSQRQVYRLL